MNVFLSFFLSTTEQGDNALGSIHLSVCLYVCLYVCLSELSCLNLSPVCVCNQTAYADNLVDAVDGLLFFNLFAVHKLELILLPQYNVNQ